MRRFLLPFLAAIAGFATLLILFPRYDPAATIHLNFDRTQAIAKARQVSAKFGVDASSWSAAVVDDAVTPTGPLRILVALSGPDGRQSVKLIFNSDGSLAGWHPYAVASSQMTIDEPKAPPRPTVTVRKRTVAKSQTGSVELTMGDPDENTRSGRASYGLVRGVMGMWFLAAFFYFPAAAFRRRVHYRVPLMLAGVQIAWGLLTYLGTAAWQHAWIDHLSNDHSLVDGIVSNWPDGGWVWLFLFVFAAVGFSIRTPGNRGKWAGLELLARGEVSNRAVGSSVAIGLLSGIGIAALPYLVVATGLNGALVFRSVDGLVAPSPLAAGVSFSACFPVMGFFGFLYPLVAKLRNRYARWALFTATGLCIVAGPAYRLAFDSAAPNLATSALLLAAYALLYFKVDLLSAMVAAISAQAVLAPVVLMFQPGGGVRASAVTVILAGAVVLAISLRSAIVGKEGAEAVPDTAPVDTAMTGETGRMRLSAEFEVARKAQEEALPSSAPLLEGYTLAGSCTPAQQVGGDLYDYFQMRDGRVGITVADVSGKGVPAALYMMVTKGLLAATVRESSDLGYILAQVNLHLHRACKKKVFVTMAAVALDPTSRRLQHARAGHNPVVWRRAARGETLMLKPAGLGLGMTSGQSFARTLKIEELELEPGDAIVLYSDGITEAIDSKMDQYGEERLVRAVEGTDGQPAEESRAAILRDMADFVGTTPPRDDVTLVVLRVAPEFAVA